MPRIRSRFVAKSELARWPRGLADDPGRGHGLHRARAAARYAPRERPRWRGCWPAATWWRSFPRGRRPTAPRCCRSRSSLLQPIVEAARPRAAGRDSAIATPDGRPAMAPAYVGETSFAASFWRICGERRAHRRSSIARAAAAGARRRIAASSRARPKPLSERLWHAGARATAPGTRAGHASRTRRERSRPTGSRSRASARWGQHEIRASTSGRRRRSRPPVRRCGCSNHGLNPSGVCAGPRFSRNSITSSAVQKRSRVQALTIDAQAVVARRGRRATGAARRHRAPRGTRARDRCASIACTSRESSTRVRRGPRRQQPGVHQQVRRPRSPPADARISQPISVVAIRRREDRRRACRRGAGARWPAATVSRWKS